MMTIVRKYESRDEQQLRVVAIQNYVEQLREDRSADAEDPAVHAYLEHIVQMQESGKGVILIAEQEKKVIGFVCLSGPASTTADKGNEGAFAFMSDLFVVPEHRNEGVGSLLVQKIEERARAMGADNVALRVAVDNAGSRHFYMKNQYQEKFVVMSKGLSDQVL